MVTAREFTLTRSQNTLRPIQVDYDVESIRKRFLKLTTAYASDVLDEMGYSNRNLKSGIYPIAPEMMVAGPAFTWSRYRGPIQRELDIGHIDCIPSISPGCVVISDDGGDLDGAHMGDIIATLYSAKGCVGAVLDGLVRDTKAVENMGFPMFSRGRIPTGGHKYSYVIDYQVPIYVHGIDGRLRVDPGDYVFGDRDGVVIIPKDITIKVLEKMEAMYQVEIEMREAIANGMDPIVAFQTYHRA